ncbi:hypothetical protein D0Z06_01020 [Geodermatophilus marinus]|nr:hypothetical protein D0Z06_01020 [Geodermatophilus sp. LHW52908]
MAEAGRGGAAPRRGVLGAARSGLLVAVALVVGLVAGALAASLLQEPAAPSVPPSSSAGSGGVPGGDLPPGGPGARFQVNNACLGALNAAQDAYLALDDLGRAAMDLDAARLDEVVRRLQPVQTQLEADLEACQVTTAVSGGRQPSPDDPAAASSGDPAD